ncbi:branched-chain amino acid ABC transporter permease [Pandoraea terrae]|uniref:Branched-chain amino acid ABC transporter permease n=1 Tax=Pandoraea terrae TaxID=1537710 RepID=A0A5E4X4M3_9BURK|nr:AzlC family ABC transporter permease [Pandoraea terrae]VVE31254.1 branched-chain amino acid ABC transporter permease [Pandoraea terrae]
MSNPSRAASFRAGARDTIPMLVGAAPFGLIFGTLIATTPMAPWHGQLMSLLVFAGSSQFIAAGLVASGTGMLIIWATTFIVNLRHMLYAANLLPHVRHLPARWRWLLGFLLTDESFAVMSSHYHKHPGDPFGHWYFLGSCISMYSNWQFWTLLGLIFGAAFPRLQTLGLDFAMVATFIAIIVPQLRRMPWLVASVVAGACAYGLRGLPYKLGLLTAVLAGIAAGMAVRHLPGRHDAPVNGTAADNAGDAR